MSRHLVLVAVLAAVSFPCDRAGAASGSRVITRATAARHGLQRAWYTQIRLDPSRARLSHLRLVQRTDQHPDTLFVQTNRATVHAIDAETGQTLWVRTVGQPHHPSTAVGANDKLVAVVNGTTLFVLNRTDGKMLWKDRVDGVPAAGPVLSQRRAFVPVLGGKVIAYRLKRKEKSEDEDVLEATKKVKEDVAASEPAEGGQKEAEEDQTLILDQQYIPTMTCVSYGRLSSQPIVTRQDELGDFVAWATTKGLFVGRVDQKKAMSFTLEFQIATASEIVSQPTFMPPLTTAATEQGVIFAASENGQVYATSARKGTEIWMYPLGEPILEPVVPIGQQVYVAAQRGGMYCFQADKGTKNWRTPRVRQFVAASKNRVYATDTSGDLLVLDAKNGARVDTIAAADLPLKYLNMQTDRVYLATTTGLVQCLHEVGASEPLRHRKPSKPPVDESAKEKKEAAPDQPAEKPEAAPADDSAPEEAEEDGNPFN